MRGDRAGNAGAVDVRAFLAAERVKAVGNRIGEFRMFGVDAEIDHGDGDVHAMRQLVRLRQAKLRHGILRGIAFARRLLVLQPIAEIELDFADAGLGGEFAAHDVERDDCR